MLSGSRIKLNKKSDRSLTTIGDRLGETQLKVLEEIPSENSLPDINEINMKEVS